MGIAKMKKFLFLVSQQEEEEFLKALQQKGIVHIDPVEAENIEGSPYSDSIMDKIDSAVKILRKYSDNEIKKLVVKSSELKRIKEIPIEEKCDEIIKWASRIQAIDKEIESLEKEKDFWSSISDINISKTDLQSDIFEIKIILTHDATVDLDIDGLYLNKLKDHVYMVVYEKGKDDAFKQLQEEIEFDIVDFSKIEENTIKDHIKKLNDRIDELNREKEELEISIKKESLSLPDILVLRNIIENDLRRDHVRKLALNTEYVSIYRGWSPEKQFDEVKKLADEYESVEIIEEEINDKEEAPVKLQNSSLMEPFEVVTDMYGTPSYYEVDPSPLLSIFFVIFFGLTLTDAGYGIIMTALVWYLMKKMPEAKKFLKLMFWGGVFTIIEGALLGGWFGDLFSTNYLNISVLHTIYEKLLWFDPMKVPMNFFKLSLAVGVVQIIFGLGVGLYKTWRQKDYGAFVFDYLTWFIMLLALLAMMFSSSMMKQFGLANGPLLPAVFGKIGGYIAMVLAVVIVLFAARHEKSWGMRIFMGILNLTILNGITSYFGDVLSYIRLMALGLVTAGIGMAINVIAFMTSGIPYVGWLITLIILIAGHIFNIAINVLGGFVHTLRLQYVEFFQKFFEGGGRRFNPLREIKRFVVQE